MSRETAATAPMTSTEGTTTIKFRSVDSHGNEEEIRSVDVRVDNGLPGVVSNVQSLYFGTASISFDASDTLSGLAGTWWRLDFGPLYNNPARQHTATIISSRNSSHLSQKAFSPLPHS